MDRQSRRDCMLCTQDGSQVEITAKGVVVIIQPGIADRALGVLVFSAWNLNPPTGLT